ncbi:MAG: AmmeMemoRadiSam system protein B [Candidatus Omnitrophica bacterium]|nr:AmmeMemoRadiSam system protein B [Candidatus Omnitrophota bacterium]
MDRKAVWAGPQKFYSDNKDLLLKYMEKNVDKTSLKQDVKAVMLPHAGYFYSGAVAAKTISRVNIPDTVIVLAPNHTGLGRPYSIIQSGVWETPLGPVRICEKLAGLILANSPLIIEDESPHINEHAIEVQLPFLKYLNANVSIVPMIVSDFMLSRFEEVGNCLALSIEQFAKPVLIVISSDLSHYEPVHMVKAKDKKVIQSIVSLNPKEMFDKVTEENISMCGFGPAAIALYACKKMGAETAELIEYQTSGEVTHDQTSVVGYAGIIIQ